MDKNAQTFVGHLECPLTGKTYKSGEIHGLSEAGRPLLVRYDLKAMPPQQMRAGALDTLLDRIEMRGE